MFNIKYLLYFIRIHLIIGTPQLNLYYTNGISENDNTLQYNCLRTVVSEDQELDYHEIISYCMSELPLKFNIENNDFFSKLTFAELSKQNITSQELYHWSAPIDIIEDYQFYLNQLSTKNDLSLSKKVFNNCTMPRFGPMCQYQLHYHYSYHSTLYEIIYEFYRLIVFEQPTLTCYTHLKCNHDLYSSCLDWSEICDGEINCLDDGSDEEHCWQLEINQCKDNEYRCRNGQCIPKSFYNDDSTSADCVDESDEKSGYITERIDCQVDRQRLFKCDDILCQVNSLVSFCTENRLYLLVKTMHSSKDSSVTEKCWSAFKCFFNFKNSEYSSCDELCKNDGCIKNIQNTCPDMIYFPNVPLLFGNVYLAYKKTDLQYGANFITVPRYICYNTSQYDDLFINISKIFFNNMTCINYKTVISGMIRSDDSVEESLIFGVYKLYKLLKKYHLTFNYTSEICNQLNMYQCIYSSKCISIYRLMDGIDDCPYIDDENMRIINNNNALIIHLEKTHFKCEKSGKYILQSFISNSQCDCGFTEDGWCEDESIEVNYLKRNILFQHICDGFIDLSPIKVNGRIETDETECEEWECNNIYTRCNNVWNCPNGEDESGCISHSILNCSSKEHLCISPVTNQFICLSIDKANNGNVDCLGATDEPTLCGKKTQTTPIRNRRGDDFYCLNQSFRSCINYVYLCNGYNNCDYGDDEQFCTTNRTSLINDSICFENNYWNSSLVEKFLCNYQVPHRYLELIYFRLDEMVDLNDNQVKNIENPVVFDSSLIEISDQHSPRCHRGLDLLVWLNNKNNLTINTCLCPSSYYGSQCQYQNQRINLN